MATDVLEYAWGRKKRSRFSYVYHTPFWFLLSWFCFNRVPLLHLSATNILTIVCTYRKKNCVMCCTECLMFASWLELGAVLCIQEIPTLNPVACYSDWGSDCFSSVTLGKCWDITVNYVLTSQLISLSSLTSWSFCHDSILLSSDFKLWSLKIKL